MGWGKIKLVPLISYDQRDKINIFCDFDGVTPTLIGTAHAFSKIQQNFQNRIPKESNQNFDIPIISSNFLKRKKRPHKKVIPGFNPGIQPTNRPVSVDLI